MKSLYESILDNENDILQNVDKKGAIFLKGEEILRKMKPRLDKIFHASTEFPMKAFLENNGLRLTKSDIEKIVNKLGKKLPPYAKFGMAKYGVHHLADQNVEEYGTAHSNPPFGFYKIEIEYAATGPRPRSISISDLDEEILQLYETSIYVLEIPETKDMLDKLNEYFEDYTTEEEIKISNSYIIKSKIGGKYRVYNLKRLKKELL